MVQHLKEKKAIMVGSSFVLIYGLLRKQAIICIKSYRLFQNL